MLNILSLQPSVIQTLHFVLESAFFKNYSPLFFDYKSFSIDSHREVMIDAAEGRSIAVELDIVSQTSQIILEVLIGPYSPVVDVNGYQRVCFWDRWCHYERPSFKAISLGLMPSIGGAKFNLNVLGDAIDYSGCAREFSFDGEKVLKVRGMHGIECHIKNISLN